MLAKNAKYALEHNWTLIIEHYFVLKDMCYK